MREGEGPLGSLRARDDYLQLLRLLDDGEEFVTVDLADLSQESGAEATSDHRGSRQRTLFILVKPLEATADDQANVIWNVDFVDLDVLAELAGFIEDFPLFDQMPVYLLDKERISLCFLVDETQKTFRRLALA